jgi:hypothetical protein
MNVAVAPTKFAKGFDGTGREVPDAYEIVDLRAALERVYATDAHLVTYVIDGGTHQPRLNKLGLPYFDRPVHTTAFFCDVDNVGHAEWTDDLLERAAIQHESLRMLQTCGVYRTAHGRRIVQPLAEPIPVANVEPYLARWLKALEGEGIAVDWACRDWTRHFRLPHVKRNGQMYRSPEVDLDRMTPIALDPIADVEAAPEPPKRSGRAPRAIPTLPPSTSPLPAVWRDEHLRSLAKAVRDGVTEDWHAMYLALGGALLSRECPPGHLSEIIGSIAQDARSVKPASHRDSARNTAMRYVEGLEITGYRTLRGRWPVVADAVDRVLGGGPRASVPTAPPLAEATVALNAAIRDAPDGLTVISAECGIGKTHAAMDVARERASTKHLSPKAAGLRAPAGSKTSISVDKTALAIQIANDLRARGTPTRRIFGPLSVIRDSGEPECRFYDAAQPLVDGGQPMRWALCEGSGERRCVHYDTCPAKDGAEGPHDARVTVGPHALLAELNATAGSTGLLVIDEPPPPVVSTALTRHDFADARNRLAAFEPLYRAAMQPVVAAFETWLDLADVGKSASPKEALAQVGADASTLVHGALAALPEDKRGRAPPVLPYEVIAAMRAPSYAKQLGAASKVLGLLYRALTSTEHIALSVQERGDVTALVVTAPDAPFAAALKRSGSVVVTDANASIHLPVLEKIVGYAPRFHTFAASDGAPIQRTLLQYRGATRRGWFSHGRVILDAGAVSAVRAAVDWLRDDAACRSVGIITMLGLRRLLEAALRPDDATVDVAWRELGQSAETLVEARAKLGPLLRGAPCEYAFGHYGAMRGLNTMANVDALITIGDPWPNVGEVQNDIAFLGLETQWQPRLKALCHAELEQAHGRLRAIHRTRPARALHVGWETPSGYGWSTGSVTVRAMPPGPSPARTMVDRSTFVAIVDRTGGQRAAARALGCGVATVSRYCSGQRAIPPAVFIALEQSAQQ